MQEKGGSGQHTKVDDVDALLAQFRQEIIIRMALNGQIGPDEFGDLYEASTSKQSVREDREALEQGRAGDFDTPFGKLATLFFKLRRHQNSSQE